MTFRRSAVRVLLIVEEILTSLRERYILFPKEFSFFFMCVRFLVRVRGPFFSVLSLSARGQRGVKLFYLVSLFLRVTDRVSNKFCGGMPGL